MERKTSEVVIVLAHTKMKVGQLKTENDRLEASVRKRTQDLNEVRIFITQVKSNGYHSVQTCYNFVIFSKSERRWR